MKVTNQTLQSPIAPTWCPGCGNFMILAAIKQSLIKAGVNEEDLVVIYGIGCSGNMADFSRVYGFHALHGRGVANAIGMKLANHKLKIVVVVGDGDCYGEGLNHLISAARGNHDITVIVHNNQMYSLTTGQSSPTTEKGRKTKSTPSGLVEEPINPLTLALSAHAGFVARGYSGDMAQQIELINEAINYEGFSLIDVFQVCPTFNKVNTAAWFAERIYKLDQKHDVNDVEAAWKKARDFEKLATGVFYKNDKLLPYHKQLHQLKDRTLLSQWSDKVDLKKAVANFG